MAWLERAAAAATDPLTKSELMTSLQNLRLSGPGDQVPNFVLYRHDKPGITPVSPPQPGSIGVDTATPLSRLLGNKPGCYIWSYSTLPQYR